MSTYLTLQTPYIAAGDERLEPVAAVRTDGQEIDGGDVFAEVRENALQAFDAPRA